MRHLVLRHLVLRDLVLRDLAHRLVVRLAAAAAAVLCLPALAAPTITVTGGPPPSARAPFAVLTTADFAGPDGPGAAWKRGFEAGCGCVVSFKIVDDALALLPALRLGGDGGAEVVVGLPLPVLEEARASGRFAPHGVSAAAALPIAWRDPTFLPLAFGWIGLIYDATRLTQPPVSWPEIAAAGPNALKIAIDDPRVSANGLDAVLWLRATQKDKAGAVWAKARPKIVVTASRAETLAKLEAGEVDLALASQSWPARRAIAEGTQRFSPAPFREGQFLQVETAAILKSAGHPQIAAAFLAYLASAEAQALIAPRRGLYPVNPAVQLPEAFGRLKLPSASVTLDGETIEAQRGHWLTEWAAALGR